MLVLKSICRFPLLTHLWQVINDIEDESPPEPLPLLLKFILKPTWFFFNWKWLVLILLLSGKILPPIWVDNYVVFTYNILHQVLIGNELLGLYDINVTHMKFLGKLRNLLVLLNRLKKKSRIIIILKDASDVSKVLGIKRLSNTRPSSCKPTLGLVIMWPPMEPYFNSSN